MQQIDNTAISKVLGQRVSAPEQYDKAILVRELRQNNRTYLNIDGDNLPFYGKDLWNNWEVGSLTDQGLPVSGIAQIIYDCNSKYIVESKSAKLYFNSFNMSKMGSSKNMVLQNIEEIAAKDLSELLETKVSVKLFSAYDNNAYEDIRAKYTILEDVVSEGKEYVCFNETPSVLQTYEVFTPIERKYTSSLLRSNCRVTHQPDHGDVFVYMKSYTPVTDESLLEYIISFRNECHFHEEICEAIYMRLMEKCKPEELYVQCKYVRRGSLDINPVGVSDVKLLDRYFTDNSLRFTLTSRQ